MRLRLRAEPASGGAWDIAGEIELAEDDSQPEPAAVAEWLSGIDPEELERVALDRLELGSGSLTAEMLAVLADWAKGAP